MAEAYDPLDYDNLARSVVHALLDAPPNELPPDDAFFGSGVYALYYCTVAHFRSTLILLLKTCIPQSMLAKRFRQVGGKAAQAKSLRRLPNCTGGWDSTPNPSNRRTI